MHQEIDNPAPLMMTAEDRRNYEATNICHFCEKEITDPLVKVIDHNHRGEGKYRGAAHTICKLHCVDPPVVVVVLHGSASYDSHSLIKDICSGEHLRQEECVTNINGAEQQKQHLPGPLSTSPSSSGSDRNSFIFFVDLQGFKNHGEFIVEEALIADVKKADYQHWLFMPPYSIKNLSQKERITAQWYTENCHGLSWNQGIYPYSEASRKFDETLFNACEPYDDRPIFIFVMGNEEEEWLKQLAPIFF
ncbi:hypothetical protein QAD02_013896 [Eretmocerus hayati]|uniref:Uncharacterized protein n=1 Tax=Eretmocerus hayati TaxID=131215 RepID=A0ACC2P6C2_9HYME|nr:hypothetical protein QAD02_013896 [Eretmocerus hayati]